MANRPQPSCPALSGGACASGGRAREDGTGSAALWDNRSAARGFGLAPPTGKVRRARAYRDRDPSGARGTGTRGGMGEGTCAAFGGGHRAYACLRQHLEVAISCNNSTYCSPFAALVDAQAPSESASEASNALRKQILCKKTN